MTLGPAPDWQHISWMVGNYNGEPILVTVDGLGQMMTGLTAYYARYVFAASLISTGSDISVDTVAVPTGEVWIITDIAVWHNDPIPRRVTVMLRASSINFLLFRNSFLLEQEVMDRQGLWVLKEGDYIRTLFVTPASGKTGYVNVVGYKIKVTS